MQWNVRIMNNVKISYFLFTGYAYYGEYPIHFAAATGNQEIYDYLIDHGANPNAQDTFGNTALHMVVICNQVVRLYNDRWREKTHQTPTIVFFYFITCVVQFIAAIIYCSTVYPPHPFFGIKENVERVSLLQIFWGVFSRGDVFECLPNLSCTCWYRVFGVHLQAPAPLNKPQISLCIWLYFEIHIRLL